MSIINNGSGYAYKYLDEEGKAKAYTGEYVQSRMACLNGGDINEILLTSELQKQFRTSTVRLGVNEWWYDIDYASKTTMYDQSVPADGSYSVRLWDANQRSTIFYDYNKNASEYYVGHENKFAVYATHDWDILPVLNLYYGARLEWQTLSGRNAAVTNAAGDYVGRFANYHIGATAPDGTRISPTRIDYHWFNYDLTAAVTYKLTKEFGFTGDFTYLVQHPKFEAFAPATLPNTDKISVPLGPRTKMCFCF